MGGGDGATRSFHINFLISPAARRASGRRVPADRPGRGGQPLPAVADAPRTDPVSCPLVARTWQITVRVPACQATESG
jgi:hypothetical protein